MKIVHILSNWKWTERAEPAVDLALAQQACGEAVTLVCGRAPPDADREVAGMARQKGLESVRTLNLPKHLDVRSVRRDVLGLRHFLREVTPDIIHCHMPNAHLLAAWARGNRQRPLIVRSSYEPTGPEHGLRARLLYRRWTDGLVVVSAAAAHGFASKHHLSGRQVCVAEPAVDLVRFSPERKMASLRDELGIKPDDRVVGLVSRIRKSRRLDIPIQAIALLAGRFPSLRLMVVGRGSRSAVQDVVLGPAEAAGVRDRVILAGYCQDERLVAAYRSMNMLAYPMPGTDKSCRTVREAMAARVPVVASRVGFLPDLVEDPAAGRLVDLSCEGMAAGLSSLLENALLLDAVSRGALDAARRRFNPALQAEKTIQLYRNLETYR